jgi:hypothetical protein
MQELAFARPDRTVIASLIDRKGPGAKWRANRTRARDLVTLNLRNKEAFATAHYGLNMVFEHVTSCDEREAIVAGKVRLLFLRRASLGT